MKTTAGLLLDLAQRGLSLEADGGDLVVRPRGKVTDELLAKLRVHKPELLAALAAPRETAYQRWEQAVREVGERWNRLFAGQQDAPWLDDPDLQQEIGQAIKAGDLGRTLGLVAEWRRAWLEFLKAGSEKR